MNPGANLLEGDRGISPQLENAIELVGEGDFVGVEAPGETAGRTDSLSVWQEALDCDGARLPPAVSPPCPQSRNTNGWRGHPNPSADTANLKPLIHTVEATQMILHFERCASLKRLRHGGDYLRKFIGWDDSASLPAVQRRQRSRQRTPPFGGLSAGLRPSAPTPRLGLECNRRSIEPLARCAGALPAPVSSRGRR